MTAENEFVKAIIQNVRGAAFNYWEIGKLLNDAENEGFILKDFIRKNEVEFGFSYARGMAFKTWYVESLNNPSVDVKLLGVDKTLALIEPLREHDSDFFVKHTPEVLEGMSVEEVRETVTRRKGNLPNNVDCEPFFLQAEDALREAVNLFSGVFLKYKAAFEGWEGKDRVLKLKGKLDELLNV